MDIRIDMTGTELETPRLILRPWRESDLGDLYEYASVPGVGEAAGWRHHGSEAESRQILALFMAEKNVLAIELRDTGKVVGSLGLHPSWANDTAEYGQLRQKEVGYVLSKAQWGGGLMTEAVKRIIPYCFDTLDLEALAVGHFRGNDRSRRVIEKCGFRFVRRGTYHSKQLCEDYDDMEYILLREEYKT